MNKCIPKPSCDITCTHYLAPQHEFILTLKWEGSALLKHSFQHNSYPGRHSLGGAQASTHMHVQCGMQGSILSASPGNAECACHVSSSSAGYAVCYVSGAQSNRHRLACV